MKEKIKQFYQSHKYIWVAIIYFLCYLPWYFGIQQRDPSRFFDMHVALDGIIPFVPAFIDVYMYWFLFVFGTGLFVFLYDKEEFYKFCLMLFGGMTTCLIIFTIFPTTFNYRPATITGTPIEKFFLHLVYSADKPTNVFPSIHVYNSLGCAIILTHSKKFKGNKKMFVFAWISAIMITLSTMFVKQHSCMAALAAMIICFILYHVTYGPFEKWRERVRMKDVVPQNN